MNHRNMVSDANPIIILPR
ncbi:Protein of unknown function [Bacillus mycoides]|nr:Protein of unknown function [Bacillus mycoides]